MKVYVALNTSPDSAAGYFKSVHNTFAGAKKSLYPDRDYNFIESHYRPGCFVGPDGFGEIRVVEVRE